jgi:hypothetical protein
MSANKQGAWSVERGTWKRPETPPKNAMPAGYMENSAGHLVRKDEVPKGALRRDRLIMGIVKSAKALQGKLRTWREDSLAKVDAFAEQAAARYGTNLRGGRNGTVMLNSYDGRYRLVVEKDDKISFNEQLAAARELINRCVEKWSEGSRKEIVALINAAFKTRAGGKLSTTRILALRQVKIEDEQWLRAMDALTDAVQIVGSATYIRIYERIGRTDKYQLVALDAYPEAGSGEHGGAGVPPASGDGRRETGDGAHAKTRSREEDGGVS